MRAVDLIVVNSECGDWSGVFVNGILETEGHSLYVSDWINLIHKYKTFGHVTKYDVSDDYISEIGNFPNRFDKIPQEFLSKY